VAARSQRVIVPLVAGGAVLLLLVVLLLARDGSDGSGASTVEPREATAERRAFTATVPLAATVDVIPAPPGTPISYMVTSRVDPLVLYRLPDRPTAATVKIAGGPPEFACTAVELATVPAQQTGQAQSSEQSEDELAFDEETGAPSASQAPSGRPVQATAETVVRCAVPSDVRVFPGLRAELLVTTAQLPEAIVVPAGAVEPESADTGHVTVIADDGEEQRRPVRIGPSNGSLVVVTAGLAEGERVLDRVPIQERTPGSQGGARIQP
jgi:macrolide-specific efflux system membrane fusion protein